LTNPAGANRQVLGVFSGELVEPLAKVLAQLGCQRGFVVHGDDGMDEITMTGSTRVAVIAGGVVELETIEPEKFGLKRCHLEDLQGGDAATNAAIVRTILGGEMGPKRDIVLINGAYALVAAGLAEDIPEGMRQIAAVLDDGLALAKLEALVRMTNS
jgi:anthranilate phosphoribosyltransferase